MMNKGVILKKLTCNPSIFQVFLSGLSCDHFTRIRCVTIGLCLQDVKTRQRLLTCVFLKNMWDDIAFCAVKLGAPELLMCMKLHGLRDDLCKDMYHHAVINKAVPCIMNLLFNPTIISCTEITLMACTMSDHVYAIRQQLPFVKQYNYNTMMRTALKYFCPDAVVFWWQNDKELPRISRKMMRNAIRLQHEHIALRILSQYITENLVVDWDDFLPYIPYARHIVFIELLTLLDNDCDHMRHLFAYCVATGRHEKVRYMIRTYSADDHDDVLPYAMTLKVCDAQDDDRAYEMILAELQPRHFTDIFKYMEHENGISPDSARLFKVIAKDPRFSDTGYSGHYVVKHLVDRGLASHLQCLLDAPGIDDTAFIVPYDLNSFFYFEMDALEVLLTHPNFIFSDDDWDRWLTRANTGALKQLLHRIKKND